MTIHVEKSSYSSASFGKMIVCSAFITIFLLLYIKQNKFMDVNSQIFFSGKVTKNNKSHNYEVNKYVSNGTKLYNNSKFQFEKNFKTLNNSSILAKNKGYNHQDKHGFSWYKNLTNYRNNATKVNSNVKSLPSTTLSGDGPVYLTAKSKGRLGNHMLQYAALFALSQKHHWIPYLTNGSFQRLHKTFGSSLSLPYLNITLTNHTIVTFGRVADDAPNSFKKVPVANVTINGFFQSHKYFDHIDDILRKEFSFRGPVQHAVESYFNETIPSEWQMSNFTRVGIQVRRGDQISEGRIQMGNIIHPPSYFEHAMDYFNAKYDKVQFIVASDDLKWCIDNIKGKHVIYTKQKDYVIDLATMAMCDHVAISLGTYSWWAGWLCKGTTIYYGVLPKPGSYMGIIYQNSNNIPPDSKYNRWRPVI